MKFVKDIFGRLWAAWGLVLFAVTMLVFMIPYLLIKLIAEPKRTRVFIKISRIWMLIFLYGIGCPLRVKGKRNFERGRNYIIVFNHNSLMDVPVSCPFVPGGNKTIAKKEMAATPVFGLLYKMGSVLVDRKSDKSRRESFQQMKHVLRIGLHMCIYPEGTRNKSDQPLKEFHDGAFRLAVETGKPIMAALIFNTRKVMPADKTFFLWPHNLEMHFMPPVYVGPEDTIAVLKEKVFHMMKEYYTNHASH